MSISTQDRSRLRKSDLIGDTAASGYITKTLERAKYSLVTRILGYGTRATAERWQLAERPGPGSVTLQRGGTSSQELNIS